jgi:putative phosphoesterase
MRTIGVISDTHGLLREEAIAALRGSDLILHAGDVGPRAIVERLREIAPVYVVRGNTDGDEWARSLPITEAVELGESVMAYMVHDIERLDIDPRSAGVGVVVFGHSHRPMIEHRDGVMYFNPGAAGHRRFTLPVTIGRLVVHESGQITAEIVDLEGGV